MLHLLYEQGFLHAPRVSPICPTALTFVVVLLLRRRQSHTITLKIGSSLGKVPPSLSKVCPDACPASSSPRKVERT